MCTLPASTFKSKACTVSQVLCLLAALYPNVIEPGYEINIRLSPWLILSVVVHLPETAWNFLDD
jgi:hypothetical protein